MNIFCKDCNHEMETDLDLGEYICYNCGRKIGIRNTLGSFGRTGKFGKFPVMEKKNMISEHKVIIVPKHAN